MKPNPAARISELETQITALEGGIAALNEKVDTVVWLYAEMIHKAKVAAVKQMLEHPALQERLKAELMQRL